MKMKKILLLWVFLSLYPGLLFSRDNPPISFQGYLSTLQSSMFDSLSGPFLNENLLHNRLNFKGYINENMTIAVEFRNRLFTGDLVRMGDYYSDRIGADPGLVDLSWNLLKEPSILFNTTVDRLWMDFQYNKFQVTLGRQRINWGQTFVWNPNDIFNAYSFFDVDYVERPGSDAIRIQYFPSYSSAAELAVKTDSANRVTAAGLFRINQWGYDMQFLAGISNGDDMVFGTGWSGAIKSLSFRGEATWFEPLDKLPGEKRTILLTTALEKILKDNSMALVQLMYSSNPMEMGSINSFYTGELSAKNLAYSKFTAFGQYTWSATPLLYLGISAMWFPDLKGYYAGPTLDYSLAENLDFSLIYQHFNALLAGTRTNLNLGFLRLKYSF